MSAPPVDDEKKTRRLALASTLVSLCVTENDPGQGAIDLWDMSNPRRSKRPSHVQDIAIVG